MLRSLATYDYDAATAPRVFPNRMDDAACTPALPFPRHTVCVGRATAPRCWQAFLDVLDSDGGA